MSPITLSATRRFSIPVRGGSAAAGGVVRATAGRMPATSVSGCSTRSSMDLAQTIDHPVTPATRALSCRIAATVPTSCGSPAGGEAMREPLAMSLVWGQPRAR